VQWTIDRLTFLRMCEDRGVEPCGPLMTLLNGETAYRRQLQLFDRADERYNAGLFHFRAERGRAEPRDELTTRLALDDKPLKEIVRGRSWTSLQPTGGCRQLAIAVKNVPIVSLNRLWRIRRRVSVKQDFAECRGSCRATKPQRLRRPEGDPALRR
jgi:hypothetical protein